MEEQTAMSMGVCPSYGSSPLHRRLAAVLLIVGGASVVLLQHNDNYYYPSAVKTQLVARLSTLQNEQLLPALQQTLSAKLQDVPRRLGSRESSLKGSKPSTELEWEKEWVKSENAYSQLRHVPDKEEEVTEGKNPLERALEGILYLGKRNTEGRRQKRRDYSKNNLRKNEGRNNIKNKQRNMKAGGGKTNPYQDQAIQEPQEEGGQHQESSFFSLTASPLAAPLMAFFGAIFLIASLVIRPSQERRRLDRLAHFHHQGNLILDEDEAEIVEFYEKEMECGGTIPFLQEAEEHPTLKRQSSCGFERKSSDSSLTKSFRRSESDPSRGTSQGDLYYSRVLETLHFDAEEEEYQVQLPEKEKEEAEQKLDSEIDQECRITLFENISSLSEEDEGESGRKACVGDASTKLSGSIEVTPHPPQHQLMRENDDDTCFVSAQSQGMREGEEGDQEQPRPQSPQSTSSTISSLTLEPEYDIEAPSKKKDALSPLHELVAEVMAGPDTSLPTADMKSENDISPTSATPPRSNLHQDRQQQQSIVKSEMKLSRRVSFSPDIKVREIPSTTRQQHGELSPEMYLYIMLFFVAVAIAMFSFMPAHPTLSPVYSMTRGEMLERAERMLSSQWELEL